jgi:predicted nucleotidyltransferase
MFVLNDYIPKKRLEQICRENHIRRLSLFGSALRNELRPDSDIDILIEFEEEHVPGLLTLLKIEIELSEMIGRKVDLRTPSELSLYFREDVISHAKVEYAA